MWSSLFWYFKLRHNPEERRRHKHCSANLKSHNLHSATSQKMVIFYTVFTLLVTYLKSTANVFPSFEKYLSNMESAVWRMSSKYAWNNNMSMV